MFSLVERRKVFYTFSALIIIVGFISFGLSVADTGSPVQLSIDFTGGTLLSLQFTEGVEEADIEAVLDEFDLTDRVIQELQPVDTEGIDVAVQDHPEGSRWSVRTVELSDERVNDLIDRLEADVAPLDRTALETSQVSSSVG